MIDIHSHLLHGLDDGSKTLETSVEMARMAAADGLTAMVCTPHASYAYPYSPQRVAEKVAELRAAIAERGISLEIGAGCDFHLSFDNIADACANPQRYTINNRSYLLVELPDLAIPPSLGEVLYNLRLSGMTPILTHPERNPSIAKSPEMMAPWINNGLLIQVTANSLTGGMGPQAEKLAFRLLSQGWVDFVATDAHNLTTRPPILSKAYDIVQRKTDKSTAERLFVENPRAVWEGKPIEPADPWESLQEEKPASFFSRFFRRD